MIDKIKTDPINEAYKQLTGDPAQDAVSVAAKGGDPETDKEQRYRLQAKEPNEEGSEEAEDSPKYCDPHEIQDAYAQLFESLSVILRSK